LKLQPTSTSLMIATRA